MQSVYFAYLRAAGGWPVFLIFAAWLVVPQGLAIGSSFWLAHWSADSVTESRSAWYYLGIYIAISSAQVLASFIYLVVASFTGLRASRKLGNDVLISVLRSPMSFFDQNPIGRIVNRFSKDIMKVDVRAGCLFHCVWECWLLMKLFVHRCVFVFAD